MGSVGRVRVAARYLQFDKNDLLSPAVAKRYRDTVLAPDGSAPAAKLVEFLGRPFNFNAFQAWLNEVNGGAESGISCRTRSSGGMGPASPPE